MQIRWILAVVALWLSLAASASAPLSALGQPWFDEVEGSGEIRSAIVACIAQDRAGLIWLGTYEGLYSFDGRRLRHYAHRPDDPYSLADDNIRALLAHSDGSIWVGTGNGGISVLGPASERFEQHQPRAGDPTALPSIGILALAEAPDGDVWAGSFDHGLSRWDASERRFYSNAEPAAAADLSDRIIVRSLLFDRQGQLWIGTRNGLFRHRPGSTLYERFGAHADAALSLDARYVYSLMQASDGRIVVGTQAHGAALLDPDSGRLTPIALDGDSERNPWVTGILEPTPGRIWLLTSGGGIDVVDLRSNAIVERIRSDRTVPGSLKLDHLGSGLQDRSGLVWVSAWGAGVQTHNPNGGLAFRGIRHSDIADDGLSLPAVYRVLPIDDQTLWVGTAGNGIDVIDPQTGIKGGHRPHATRAGALRDGSILSIAHGADGSIWVGTQLSGLQRYQPESGQFSEPYPQLPRGQIWQLLVRKNGELVVGMSSGVFILNPADGSFSPLARADGEPFRDGIRSIAEDGAGRLWVMGNTQVLMQAPGAQHAVDVIGTPFPINKLEALHVDGGGSLWLTGPGFIFRLREFQDGQPQFEDYAARMIAPAAPGSDSPDERAAVRIAATAEVPGSFGGSLLEDRRGRIWTPWQVLDPARRRIDPIGPADGLYLGTSGPGSYVRLTDGRFAFTGNEGLVIVDPERFEPWEFVAPVVATELKIDGRARPQAQLANGLTLPSDARNFSIEFAALDYSAPAANRYAYRLAGYDADWIETDAEHRIASYGGLWPGQYSLEIRGSGRNDVFAARPLTIPIHVLPAFWQTRWFVALVALALVALGWGALHWRTARLGAEAHRLQALVDARTADVLKLGDLGKRLAGSLDLEATLQTLYRMVGERLQADVFLVGLVEAARCSIAVVFVFERGQRLAAFEIPLDDPLQPAAWCVRAGRELIVQQREDLRAQLGSVPPPRFRDAMESIACLPLAFEDRIIGCVSVQALHKHAFDPAALEFLRGLASYAAIAVANAQSFEQVQSARQETEATLAKLTQTQQQLVQQEKMAALGTLTAGVAHEINNPTNFADGAVQNLTIEHQRLHDFLRHLAGEDAAPEVLQAIAERFSHLEEMTATAHEGHERIKRIVRDLRQFTRLDEAAYKAVAIAEPIQSTVNLVRTRYDRIAFDLDLAYNPSIDCQPAKLGQVFLNLIMNACEAIGECTDGRAGRIEIRTSADGAFVRIDVADNGRGMDEGTRQRVFEPFFTTKSVGAGTGLGLAIVFGIVNDHGGSLEVSSTPGDGTKFSVRLPLRAAPREASA